MELYTYRILCNYYYADFDMKIILLLGTSKLKIYFILLKLSKYKQFHYTSFKFSKNNSLTNWFYFIWSIFLLFNKIIKFNTIKYIENSIFDIKLNDIWNKEREKK